MDNETFRPGEAPNYTNAFLTMAGAITFMSLWIIAGLFGFVWVLFSAFVAEMLYRARRPRG